MFTVGRAYSNRLSSIVRLQALAPPRAQQQLYHRLPASAYYSSAAATMTVNAPENSTAGNGTTITTTLPNGTASTILPTSPAPPSQVQGDLNNTSSMRVIKIQAADPAYNTVTLAIPESEDDATIREKYRPFLLTPGSDAAEVDWIKDLELSTVLKMAEADIAKNGRIKVLVLYGSLRGRSYSRFLAFEMSRVLWRLGCDVRVFDPSGLPVKDDVQHGHPKVQELRELSKWSDGHVWVSPEQHGNLVSHLPLLI